MKLFMIGPFTAERVALDGNTSVSGLPAMTAVAGISDMVFRHQGYPAANNPIALILHDIQPSPGRAKPKADKHGRPGEAIERFGGRVEASIVLMDTHDRLTTDAVADAMPHCRFAGGMLELGSRPVSEAASLAQALKHLPRGHLVVDRSEILDAANAHASDPLDGLLDICTLAREDRDSPWRRLYLPDDTLQSRNLVPIAVGYQALESLTEAAPRQQTRSSTLPHVFAEGVTGIGELVTSRRVARTQGDDHCTNQPLFWRWEPDPATNTLCVAGRNSNFLENEVSTNVR